MLHLREKKKNREDAFRGVILANAYFYTLQLYFRVLATLIAIL
jgi:hypothetical protein